MLLVCPFEGRAARRAHSTGRGFVRLSLADMPHRAARRGSRERATRQRSVVARSRLGRGRRVMDAAAVKVSSFHVGESRSTSILSIDGGACRLNWRAPSSPAGPLFADVRTGTCGKIRMDQPRRSDARAVTCGECPPAQGRSAQTRRRLPRSAFTSILRQRLRSGDEAGPRALRTIRGRRLRSLARSSSPHPMGRESHCLACTRSCHGEGIAMRRRLTTA